MLWQLALAEASATAAKLDDHRSMDFSSISRLLNKAQEVLRPNFELERAISKNLKRQKNSRNLNNRRANRHEQLQAFFLCIFYYFTFGNSEC